MKTIKLKHNLTEQEADELKGKFINENYFDELIDFDCDVYKPNGQPLLFFRKNYIKPKILKTAYENMLSAAQPTNNRGAASGGERKQRILNDGTLSKSTQNFIPGTDKNLAINSGIAGYFDRNAHYDFCRTTAFTKKKLNKFQEAMPLFEAVNNGFKEFVPEAYNRQKAMAKATHPNYVIGDTAFTTITINKNYRAAVHKDAGDYDLGFGNLVAYLKNIKPVYLIFPKFKVAVNLCTNDLLLADVHEYHGNNEIVKTKEDGVRLSFVMYYRKKMYKCLSPNEELKRIQTNQRIVGQKYIGVI